jgi:hypothetical protein
VLVPGNDLLDRGTIAGFALRVRKNTDFLVDAFERGEDVHIVTQFVLSLLGLIIFPYEEMARRKSFPIKTMKELEDEGWPKFNVIRGRGFETLEDLIEHLRDAVSHYQIEFEPQNERHLDNITIILGWPKGRPDSRRTKINGAAFCAFVRKFSTYIGGLVE